MAASFANAGFGLNICSDISLPSCLVHFSS